MDQPIYLNKYVLKVNSFISAFKINSIKNCSRFSRERSSIAFINFFSSIELDYNQLLEKLAIFWA